jgi:hypothetical protein
MASFVLFFNLDLLYKRISSSPCNGLAVVALFTIKSKARLFRGDKIAIKVPYTSNIHQLTRILNIKENECSLSLDYSKATNTNHTCQKRHYPGRGVSPLIR